MSLFHIEHIVIVVMENRSFDHMLGYLNIPPPLGAGRQDVLGLSGNEENVVKKEGQPDQPFRVTPLRRTAFRECPGHSFSATAQQIGEDRNMQGFAQHFANHLGNLKRDPREDIGTVMGYYTAAEVPVYDFLARNFVVFDQWFALRSQPYVAQPGILGPTHHQRHATDDQRGGQRDAPRHALEIAQEDRGQRDGDDGVGVDER